LAEKKEKKFLNKYPINSQKLAGYDYGFGGSYFITIKTHHMKHYLGSVVQTSHGTSHQKGRLLKGIYVNRCAKSSILSNMETCLGTSGQLTLIQGPYLATYVQLTQMGLKAKENWEAIPFHFPFVQLDAFQIMPNHIHAIINLNRADELPWNLNEFKARSGTLGTIINLYKGSITKYARENKIEFKWHPRYHDTIIRNKTSLGNIRNYIINNPYKWIEKYNL
jgi:REP element-mobilizing transposase RayT